MRISQLRKDANLSQQALAKIMKTSQSSISEIETILPTNCKVDTFRRYIEATGGTLIIMVKRLGNRIDIIDIENEDQPPLF